MEVLLENIIPIAAFLLCSIILFILERLFAVKAPFAAANVVLNIGLVVFLMFCGASGRELLFMLLLIGSAGIAVSGLEEGEAGNDVYISWVFGVFRRCSNYILSCSENSRGFRFLCRAFFLHKLGCVIFTTFAWHDSAVVFCSTENGC